MPHKTFQKVSSKSIRSRSSPNRKRTKCLQEDGVLDFWGRRERRTERSTPRTRGELSEKFVLNGLNDLYFPKYSFIIRSSLGEIHIHSNSFRINAYPFRSHVRLSIDRDPENIWIFCLCIGFGSEYFISIVQEIYIPKNIE